MGKVPCGLWYCWLFSFRTVEVLQVGVVIWFCSRLEEVPGMICASVWPTQVVEGTSHTVIIHLLNELVDNMVFREIVVEPLGGVLILLFQSAF